jgi:hypothetical protein
MGATARKRPWLAAVLAIHPGLGHVYLREWARALLWFGLLLTTLSLLVPETAAPAALTVDSLLQMGRELSTAAKVTLPALTAVSMLDAYWVAVRNNERQRMAAVGARCPNCGREADPELSFCYWCTTELDGTGAEPSTDTGTEPREQADA